MAQRSAALWALLLACVVGAAALVPAQQRAFLHSHGLLHPWFHVGIFGAVAYLFGRSARSAPAQLALVVAVASFGCLTEFAESHLYASPLEFNDMTIDALGAVLGAGLAALFGRRGEPTEAPEGLRE